ncbi:MAG: hypothetical protein V3U65_13660 [Granulosicoccaceae bacterium]
MKSKSVIILSIATVAMLIVGGWQLSTSNHGSGGSGHAMTVHRNGMLEEGGQSIFAALSEVISVFEADDKTDWNAIDIDGLRSHLLDMNDLMTHTHSVTDVVGGNRIRFNVVANGGNDSLGAIHRMAKAHSQFIQASRGWKITAATNDSGATIDIVVNEEADLMRLKALGFYGFMSLDSHHQAHHYQMAMGVGH